jgi:hypothetical protein
MLKKKMLLKTPRELFRMWIFISTCCNIKAAIYFLFIKNNNEPIMCKHQYHNPDLRVGKSLPEEIISTIVGPLLVNIADECGCRKSWLSTFLGYTNLILTITMSF